MKIAEFFVGLGVKGSDDANKKLGKADNHLKEMKKNSLALKAAIAGVIYGVGRMMGQAGEWGSSLQRFGNETGLSAEKLQQLQQAALNVGVAAGDIEGSIRGVQQAMVQWQRYGDAPKGIVELQRLLGGEFDVQKAWQDPFYVLERLQKVAKDTTQPIQLINDLLGNFGVSQSTVGFLRSGQNLNEIKQGAALSEKQIKSLSRMNAQMERMKLEIQKAFADFFSKNGSQLIKTFNEFIPVLKDFLQVASDLSQALLAFNKEQGVSKAAVSLASGEAFERSSRLIKQEGLLKSIFTGKDEAERLFKLKDYNNQVKANEFIMNQTNNFSIGDGANIVDDVLKGVGTATEKAIVQSQSLVREN